MTGRLLAGCQSLLGVHSPLKDFEYAAAATVEEAVSLLAARGEAAKMLAGGTDILVQLREGLRQAELVVDVKKIPELTRIQRRADGALMLGAAAPACRLYRDQRLRTEFSALTDAARIIGGWQIQSRASIGGNLCNASPAADSIPALMALGAVCHVAGAQGRRTLPVESFCVAPGKNALARGELLVTIELPAPRPHAGSHYLRFIPRNEMDIAVVGAGAWVQLSADGRVVEAARIALGAVAPTPVMAAKAAQALVGQPALEESFATAGAIARESATPISDMRGPAEYRLHLVGVLVKRALTRAAQRARGETNGKH